MIRSKKPQKEKPTEFAHQSAFVKNQDKYVKSKCWVKNTKSRWDRIIRLANYLTHCKKRWKYNKKCNNKDHKLINQNSHKLQQKQTETANYKALSKND